MAELLSTFWSLLMIVGLLGTVQRAGSKLFKKRADRRKRCKMVAKLLILSC